MSAIYASPYTNALTIHRSIPLLHVVAVDTPGVGHNKLGYAHRDSMSQFLVGAGRNLRRSALLVDGLTCWQVK